MLNPQWHLRIHNENAGSSGRGALAANRKASPLSGFAGSPRTADVGRTAPKSVVVLSAQGPREVPLNVTAVWSSGERIVECVLAFSRVFVWMLMFLYRLAQKEMVTSSGAYTYGRARVAADMGRMFLRFFSTVSRLISSAKRVTIP
jgi:calpain-7